MYKNRQSLPSHKLHLIFLHQQAITKFSIKHVNVYNMDSPWFVQKILKIYIVIVFMFFLYQINTQPIFSFPSPLFLHPLPSFSSTSSLHFPPTPFCYQNTSPKKLLFLHNFFCFYLFIRIKKKHSKFMDMIFTRTRKKMILHEETRVSVFFYLE